MTDHSCERIKGDMSWDQIIVAMGDNDVATIQLLDQILTKGRLLNPDEHEAGIGLVIYLDSCGLYGKDIYLLYKVVCGGVFSEMAAVMYADRDRLHPRVNENSIKRAIRAGKRKDCSELLLLAKQRYLNFDPDVVIEVL
jgi:hypothetical protein